jgi:phosphoglycerate dehydrogenase-like enzyme
MRIAIGIHDLPVWSIPLAQVERISRLLPGDVIVDAREPDERLRAIADADVAFTTKLSGEEFALARNLRWVHSSAVGIGPVLSPALVASSVVVSNSKGIHSPAIAEHAIALVLALRRSIHTSVYRQAAREWAQVELEAAVVRPLAETEMLVVGLGTIGERVARMAAALGMRVTAVRRRVDATTPGGIRAVIGPEQIADVLPSIDVVVLAVPTTDETKALIGREELALMKPKAILVNVARGKLVDEDALADALEQRRIAGAGLDAFRVEPLPAGHRLWALPNALITPHSASFTGDYWTPVVDLFLDNVARFKRGAPLRNLVDKVRGY